MTARLPAYIALALLLAGYVLSTAIGADCPANPHACEVLR